MNVPFGMSSCYTYIKLERSRHSIYSVLCLLFVQTADTVPPPWHAYTFYKIPSEKFVCKHIIGDVSREGSLRCTLLFD